MEKTGDERAELLELMDSLRGTLELLRASGLGHLYPGGATGPEAGAEVIPAHAPECHGEDGRPAIEDQTGPLVLFVVSAPAARSEAGAPWEGPEGELLARIATKAMGLSTDEVGVEYAPEGLNEEASEALIARIRESGARVAIIFGGGAALAVLGAPDAASVRGRFHDLSGMSVMPTHGTAEMLRNPGLKREVWEDIKLCLDRL